ncbi:MAG: hypothetical protein ABF709_05070 [Leuconostoc pseudomesenteroides]|uniref:hypothetical protein n=1 Tax=Leuconostoc pseudomesenteroides TaxID=33968 RepID=UPI001E534832|nr:hypothetical protein [Leuconostoc pseudomesenteroides]MCC7668909.1 hypothetical protein [Leuconostoc pseudomesenteroides]
MDLIPVLYEAEERYGYMSDEAISIFQKVLKRTEEKRGVIDPYEEAESKNKFIERMPLDQQQNIIEMYSLGYSSREVGKYLGVNRTSVNHYWQKMSKIGRLKLLSQFERNERHRELLKILYRGKFNDVELIRMCRGDAK